MASITVDVSRKHSRYTHTHTHTYIHTRQNSSGREISPIHTHTHTCTLGRTPLEERSARYAHTHTHTHTPTHTYTLGRTPVEERSARHTHKHPHIHTDSARLLWRRDQPDAETSTLQHTKLTRDRCPCLRRDSNQQSQQLYILQKYTGDSQLLEFVHRLLFADKIEEKNWQNISKNFDDFLCSAREVGMCLQTGAVKGLPIK